MDLDDGGERNVHRGAIGTRHHEQVHAQAGEGAGHGVGRTVDRHPDGGLFGHESVQRRAEVQPVHGIAHRAVPDEGRTAWREPDGGDGATAQQAELATCQAERHEVAAEGLDATRSTHSGGQREGHLVGTLGQVHQEAAQVS